MGVEQGVEVLHMNVTIIRGGRERPVDDKIFWQLLEQNNNKILPKLVRFLQVHASVFCVQVVP